MKRLWLTLFLLILTGTLSFCQTTYPKKIVFESDTLVAVTGEQLVQINLAIAGQQRYRAENEVLRQEVHVADSISRHWQQVTTLQDSIIVATREKVAAAEQLNKDFGDLLTQQKKKNLRTTIGVGVGGILLGVIAGLLLVK
jgi:hypothetical protein